MFMRAGFYLMVFTAIFLGCQEDESMPATLTGKINSSEIPAEEIDIIIDGAFVGRPAPSGEFSVKTKFGEHEFLATAGNADRLFTQYSQTITINESNPEFDLGLLKLPEPPVLEVTFADYDSIVFSWNRSTASGFREYKVYFGSILGSLEDQWNLVFLSTNSYDTTVTVSNKHSTPGLELLYPGNSYYCRVFVMDEFGKIGGSNLVKVIHKDPHTNIVAKMTQTGAFVLPHSSEGLAYDGQYFWLGMPRQMEDSLSFRRYESKITKFDYQTGDVKKTFTLKHIDELIGPITIDHEGFLWAYLDGVRSKPDRLVKIDTATGHIVKQFSSPEYIEDLDIDPSGNLILLDEWGYIIKLHTSNGAIEEEFVLPLGSGWRGIGSVENELWGIHWFSAKILMFDQHGQAKGLVENDLIQLCNFCGGGLHKVQFLDHNRLAVMVETRMYLFDIERY